MIAQGTGARQQQVDHEPDHDGRQPHQAVQDHDQRAAAPKLVHGDRGAQGKPDGAADQDGHEADAEAQEHDADELRVRGEDQFERLSGGFGDAVQGALAPSCGGGVICTNVPIATPLAIGHCIIAERAQPQNMRRFA